MSADTPEVGRAWAGEPPPDLGGDQLERAFRYFDRWYAPHLPADRAARVLDFGCGFGTFLAYLDSRGCSQAMGFDVDARCVDFCAAHVAASVIHAPDAIAFLASQVGQFDFILARQVVYYFPARESNAYFRALAQALKPNGRIMVEVFNGATATGLYPMLDDHWIATAFTEHTLRWALERAGLRIVNLFGVSGVGGGLRYDTWRAAHKLWTAALRAIYTLERGRDALNPTILEKNLIAVAERVS